MLATSEYADPRPFGIVFSLRTAVPKDCWAAADVDGMFGSYALDCDVARSSCCSVDIVW